MKRATLILAALILMLGGAGPARAGSVTLTLSGAGNSLLIDFNSPFAEAGSTAAELRKGKRGKDSERKVVRGRGGKIQKENRSNY